MCVQPHCPSADERKTILPGERLQKFPAFLSDLITIIWHRSFLSQTLPRLWHTNPEDSKDQQTCVPASPEICMGRAVHLLKEQKDSADRSCGVPQTVDQRQKDRGGSSTLYHNLSAAHQTVHAVRCMPSAVFDPATTPLFP